MPSFPFQKNVISLLYVAGKYNVDLATHVEDIFLKRSEKEESNSLLFLSFGFKFNFKKLKESALSEIHENFGSEVVEEKLKVSYILFS